MKRLIIFVLTITFFVSATMAFGETKIHKIIISFNNADGRIEKVQVVPHKPVTHPSITDGNVEYTIPFLNAVIVEGQKQPDPNCVICPVTGTPWCW